MLLFPVLLLKDPGTMERLLSQGWNYAAKKITSDAMQKCALLRCFSSIHVWISENSGLDDKYNLKASLISLFKFICLSCQGEVADEVRLRILTVLVSFFRYNGENRQKPINVKNGSYEMNYSYAKWKVLSWSLKFGCAHHFGWRSRFCHQFILHLLWELTVIWIGQPAIPVQKKSNGKQEHDNLGLLQFML